MKAFVLLILLCACNAKRIEMKQARSSQLGFHDKSSVVADTNPLRMLATALLAGSAGGFHFKPALDSQHRQQRNRQQQRQQRLTARMGIAEFLSGIGQEFDDFVDDAMNQRLGNGAKFYGKRKSAFYGQDDDMKKTNPRIRRADEDYLNPRRKWEKVSEEQTNSDELKEDFKEATKVNANRQRVEKAFGANEEDAILKRLAILRSQSAANGIDRQEGE